MVSDERRQYNKEYYRTHKELLKYNDKIYRDSHKIEKIEYRKDYNIKNKEKISTYNKEYKSGKRYEVMKKIADFHNSEIKCWRCGEKRLCVLTIGHVNQDGKQDRIKNGGRDVLFRKIISGERDCGDLQIECMNCNSCLQWYGKYPDEITE